MSAPLNRGVDFFVFENKKKYLGWLDIGDILA